MALSHQQRDQIERRIHAAIDRLLAGQIPPGGACDVKTLAREAGISRASLYRTWGHLKDEFEKRRTAAWAAGQQPDPREARIARLRNLNQRLTGKLARTHTEFNELKERHRLLVSVLAAKDDELQRLRRELSTFSRTSPAPMPGQQQEDDVSGIVPLHRT
jgi:AcrR family transcriptional regulator